MAINDCLDPKSAAPPPECQPHREVVRKARGLLHFVYARRAVRTEFAGLAQAKLSQQEGARMFDALVQDAGTHWDSDLALLERIYYFEREILSLLRNVDLVFPEDFVMSRFEFDLAYAMTLVLTPLRIFTNFLQNQRSVTLGYLPMKIDELISSLAPGSFVARMRGCADGVVAQMEIFQRFLVQSIEQRFGDLFEGGSLAARYLLPGNDLFAFTNFSISAEKLEAVKDTILTHVMKLMPSATHQQRERKKLLATAVLEDARLALDEENPDVDPLTWWPNHPDYAAIFPVAKMFLQIPAASTENDPYFIVDHRRTRVDVDNFRREYRLRRWLSAGVTAEEKVARSVDLMERYSVNMNLSRDEIGPQ